MRRITSMCIGVALALTFGMATKAAAQACTPSAPNAGPFSIDGCVTTAVNSKQVGDAPAVVDPNSSTKEIGPINGSTTKLGNINTAPTPMLGLTNPNASVDLNTIFTQTAPDQFGDIWYYFGWKRDSNNGSGFISIELQKTGVPLACTGTGGYSASTCNPWSGRQTGDVLILWDQQGGSTAISIRIYNAALQAFGPAILLNPANGDVKAQYSADLTSGEAAINFSNVIFPSDGSCQSFANTIPGTVTGNSDTADYKDAVLAAFPPVSNCGVVKVTKATNPAGLTGPAGGFVYTVARSGGEAVRFDGTLSLSDNLTGHNDSDTFSDILNGTNFTVAEAAQVTPWAYVSTSCVLHLPGGDVPAGPATGFTVVGGVTTECTITNKLETGTITVFKHVINDNGGTKAAADFTMFLGAGNPSFSGSEAGVTTTLNAGTAFVVSESSVAGYTGSISIAGDTCSATMVAGAAYVCHVTNNDSPPSLTLNKIVSNSHGGTKAESAWTLTANGGAAGTLSGPGAAGNADVVSGAAFIQGTYALSEALIAGSPGIGTYDASAWSCAKNGGQPVQGASVTLGLGDSAVCTITNSDTKAAPSVATAQRAVLHDSATITGIRPGASDAAAARVTFSLFTNSACSGAPLGSEQSVISAGGTATTTTGVLVNTVGSTLYYWKVDYSGDAFNQSNSSCGKEQITVNINNNVQ